MLARPLTFVVLFSTLLALVSACGSNGGSSPALPNVDTHDGCQATVYPTNAAAAFLDDIFDGNAGTYHLVQLDVFSDVDVQTKYANNHYVSYIAGTAKLSAHAQPNQVTAEQSFLCSALISPDSSAEYSYSAHAELPMIIERNSGSYSHTFKTSYEVYNNGQARFAHYEDKTGNAYSIFGFKRQADDKGWELKFYKISEDRFMMSWTMLDKDESGSTYRKAMRFTARAVYQRLR